MLRSKIVSRGPRSLLKHSRSIVATLTLETAVIVAARLVSLRRASSPKYYPALYLSVGPVDVSRVLLAYASPSMIIKNELPSSPSFMICSPALKVYS